MRGRIPKDPELRQRRNKKATAATLPPAVPVLDLGEKPKLPERSAELPYHPLTVAFWRDVWDSPMARKYLTTDLHGLFVLADTVDRFWWEPDTRMRLKLAQEIRQLRVPYGLTPLDRNRLDWKIETPKPAETQTTEPAKVRADFDPGKVLEYTARSKRG